MCDRMGGSNVFGWAEVIDAGSHPRPFGSMPFLFRAPGCWVGIGAIFPQFLNPFLICVVGRRAGEPGGPLKAAGPFYRTFWGAA